MKRKIFVLSLIIILLSLFIVGCAPAEEAISTEPIKIAINVWPGYAHTFVAQEKGFFEKNGVEVELILKEDYADAQELYTNNEVDGILEVYTDTIFHNAEGKSTKVVYVADYSDTGDVIIGKPEFNSLADLKGKKLGIEGINTFSHLFVLAAVEKAGLKESEVQFEQIPANKILTALDEGRIDAGHTWEPTKSAALKKGYKELGKAGDVPGIITDVLAFNSKIIEERPEEIQAIVKSILEARDFLDTNEEEAIKIMAEAESMDEEEMKSGLQGAHLLNLDENKLIFINDPSNDVGDLNDLSGVNDLYDIGLFISNFYSDRGQISTIPNFDNIIEPKFVNNIK